MNKLDDFFKEKLTDHAITPPAGAWEKVSAGLIKKSSPMLWLRWAAVLLFCGLLIGTLWLQRKGTEAPLAKAETQPAQKKGPAIESSESSPLVQATETKKERNQKKKAVVMPLTLPEAQKSVVSFEVAELEKEAHAVVPVEIVPARPTTSIVLTYTLDAVETPAAATTQTAASDKKNSSFKRMVEFANTMKNSESTPLENLRVMKEELFALDLRKKTTSKKQ